MEMKEGPAIRCDWGRQYIADAWISEVKWLGCLEDARRTIGEFVARYNDFGTGRYLGIPRTASLGHHTGTAIADAITSRSFSVSRKPGAIQAIF